MNFMAVNPEARVEIDLPADQKRPVGVNLSTTV
jgi:hypothetical protein